MSPIGPVDISSFLQNPERLTGAKGAAAGDAASLTQALGSTSAQAATQAGAQPASFSTVLENAVSDVNSKMQVADAEKGKLLSGETGNVHQAMIAVQEAGVAFSLMVEVRNKLADSYQELMRMQV
jgi:flagellar hook-basal body complex protein FliE